MLQLSFGMLQLLFPIKFVLFPCQYCTNSLLFCFKMGSLVQFQQLLCSDEFQSWILNNLLDHLGSRNRLLAFPGATFLSLAKATYSLLSASNSFLLILVIWLLLHAFVGNLLLCLGCNTCIIVNSLLHLIDPEFSKFWVLFCLGLLGPCFLQA